MKIKIFVTLFLALFCGVVTAQNLFSPRLSVDGAEKPVTLSDIKVELDIVGDIAVTSYHLSFYNPNNRVLEGELTFPLSQSEAVVGYALEVNGKMRNGVVVKTADARQIYEEIVNRNVDPGFVEKIAGNNYRTRLYPIPAKGHKSIILRTQQRLVAQGDNYIYTMPITSESKLQTFGFKASIHSQYGSVVVVESPIADINFKTIDNIQQVAFEQRDFSLTKAIKFAIPFSTTKQSIYTQSYDGQNWFYATIPTGGLVASKNGGQLTTILWDCSLSGLKRDLKLEMEFVESYIRANINSPIKIITFSDVVGKAVTFSAASRCEVISYLKSIKYDGASDMSILKRGYGGKVLVFSDGMSSLGQKAHSLGGNVYAICSAVSADYTGLNILSDNTVVNLNNMPLKEAVDFVCKRPLAVVDLSDGRGMSDVFWSVGNDGTLALCGKLIKPSSRLGVQLNGVVNNGKRSWFSIKVEQQNIDAKTNILSRLWAQSNIDKLSLAAESNFDSIVNISTKHGVVTDYTSLLVLETLDDYVRYNVTPPTELLTDEYYRKLESYNERKKREREWAEEDELNSGPANFDDDYCQYYEPIIDWWSTDFAAKQIEDAKAAEIEAARQEAERKEAERKEAERKEAERKEAARQEAERQEAERQEAARQEAEKLTPAPTPIPVTPDPVGNIKTFTTRGQYSVSGTVRFAADGQPVIGATITICQTDRTVLSDVYGKFRLTQLNMGESFEVAYSGLKTKRVVYEGQQNIDIALEEDAVAIEAVVVTGYGFKRQSRALGYASTTTMSTKAIALMGWKPDNDYIDQIDSLPTNELYAKYIELRASNYNNPSFYVDVADVFARRGLPKQAGKILANIVEITNANWQLVNICGQKLIEYGLYDDAVKVFQYGLTLREEYPQSCRDLALALRFAGRYQDAADMLYSIMTKKWSRFDEIKAVAFTEFNNIISMHRGRLDLSKFDKRLIHHLPVDQRIILAWSIDHSEMDLFIEEPFDQSCTWSAEVTNNGGQVFNHTTDGFGPEQYMIRVAPAGVYKIKVDHYEDYNQTVLMPVTIFVDMFSDYSHRLKEQFKRISVRLNSDKDNDTDDDLLLLGEITVK